MCLLHAGLAVALVVQHDNAEVPGPPYADRSETPQPHQHFAVACDDENPPLRLRERKAQTDRARRPHCAPQRKSERMVARSGTIPSRGAESGDDQQPVAPLQQRSHDLAAIERLHRFSSKDFTPISCCEIRSATALCSSKATFAALFATALASSARPRRSVRTPPRRSASGVA